MSDLVHGLGVKATPCTIEQKESGFSTDGWVQRYIGIILSIFALNICLVCTASLVLSLKVIF